MCSLSKNNLDFCNTKEFENILRQTLKKELHVPLITYNKKQLYNISKLLAKGVFDNSIIRHNLQGPKYLFINSNDILQYNIFDLAGK